MKERPILFSGPMVRALLDGSKTQTRMVVKPQPDVTHDNEPYWHIGGYRAWAHRGTADPLRMGTHNPLSCPYGRAGDRLWVREAWRSYPMAGEDGASAVIYRSDEKHAHLYPWKPSIHMPRWASRITLEIVSVRVDRLQDISEEDAVAEGCAIEAMTPTGDDSGSAIWGPGGYCALWEFINGPGSWDQNPWVWVVEFKRVTP